MVDFYFNLYYIDFMDYISVKEPLNQPSLLDIHINNRQYKCNVLHADSNHRFATKKKTLHPFGHRHKFFHVLIYIGGDDFFFFNGKTHPAKRGTLVLADSNIEHVFSPINKTELYYAEITFSYTSGEKELELPFHKLMSIIAGMPIPEVAMPLYLKEQDTQGLLQIMQSVIIHLKSGTDLNLFHAHRLMTDMFGFIVDNIYAQKAELQIPEEIPGRIWQTRLAIEKNFNKKISLTHLAKAACLNPDYFCRTFKKTFGISPIAYQQELRISAAKNLLLTTSLRCNEIAAQTGFYDEYSFSKIFKKTEGITPTQFRSKN